MIDIQIFAIFLECAYSKFLSIFVLITYENHLEKPIIKYFFEKNEQHDNDFLVKIIKSDHLFNLISLSLRHRSIIAVCGHVLCHNCALTIAKAKDSANCPTCRKPYASDNIIKIFEATVT